MGELGKLEHKKTGESDGEGNSTGVIFLRPRVRVTHS